MSDIDFSSKEKVVFPTKYHGEVTLSKKKWEIICNEPERRYYRYNGEKVPTTLINPDLVRHHRWEPSQFIYYKSFNTIKIDERIEVSNIKCKFFAVIIDVSTKRVCTVYPVPKPKEGKEYKP